MVVVWKVLPNPCVGAVKSYKPEMANVCLTDVFLLVSFCVACGIPGGLHVPHAPAFSEFAFWEEEGFLPHCTACHKTTLPPCMAFFVPHCSWALAVRTAHGNRTSHAENMSMHYTMFSQWWAMMYKDRAGGGKSATQEDEMNRWHKEEEEDDEEEGG